MLRSSAVFLAMSLVALAVVGLVGPAAAHTSFLPDSAVTGSVDMAVSILIAAPTPPTPPWYLATTVALLAALGWRRSRRALVVVGLVLLLCVFAFEDALHSVHHGVDPKQQAGCTLAAAAAHLAAVQVDAIAPQSLLLLRAGQVLESTPSHSPTRFESPDQGRAPPSAIL